MPEATAGRGGLQSLDAALRVLHVMADARGPMALSDLARACDLPPSNVHRYLASFQTAGLVSQAGRSGRYDLGPEALRLGLAAIARNDFVNRTADALPELTQATGMTALLSVWGEHGPTVVRWERAETPTVTSMGLGTTLPLLHSATGLAFLTWAPRAPIAGTLAAESQQTRGESADRVDIDHLTRTVRGRGFATADGDFIPGLVALAAPVLDWQGEAQVVVTLIGTDPAALRPGAAEATALIDFCQRLSFATT